MITMKNVNFSYECGEKESLKNINLDILPGECMLVTGESGCGKTSLIRLINGLIPNFHKGELSGEIEIDGKDMKTCTIRQISKQTGSVFQNPKSQFFNVVVKDELAFKSENYKEQPDTILKNVYEVLNQHNMPDFAERNLFTLSGGEKQKISCLSGYTGRK